MAEDSTVFVGIDAAKAKHAVAIAEPGRSGEVRYLGEIEASPEAVRKLIARLAARHGRLYRPGVRLTLLCFSGAVAGCCDQREDDPLGSEAWVQQ